MIAGAIVYEEKSCDESSYARLVADHLGTEHYERRFTDREMPEQPSPEPRFIRQMDK
jgi:asparagine synthetase B (glutamine-hydrolysing)